MDDSARTQQGADELLKRVQGAIAAGIRQAAADECSAIRYHERRATPDLDWVYSNAENIAEYVTSSKPWNDLHERLAGDA